MVLEGLGACTHEQGCQEGLRGGAEPFRIGDFVDDGDGIDSIEWTFVVCLFPSSSLRFQLIYISCEARHMLSG